MSDIFNTVSSIEKMRIGIVGSRTFPQLQLVEWFIRDLPNGVVIVSGGAPGVDEAAAHYGKMYGFEVIEKMPEIADCNTREEYRIRYYERNQRIVDSCHLLVAFTEKDYGGTWDTVKRAKRAGKPVKIIRPSLLFPADKVGKEAIQVNTDEYENTDIVGRKGAGPYQIKRASLGSYALRRKCYIGPEEWAEIVCMKETNPLGLADMVYPDMVNFFETNGKFGAIDAVVCCPRSIRNLDKGEHAMEIVGKRLAKDLQCEYVDVFEPWNKKGRGRHAEHDSITVKPSVTQLIGRVVWVIDDIYTSGYTMRSAVQSLMSLEVHAHGLAWVYMA